MSIETTTVIRPSATYYVVYNLNNLRIIYNKDLIDTTTNSLTAQKTFINKSLQVSLLLSYDSACDNVLLYSLFDSETYTL